LFARGQPSQPCEVDVNSLLRDAARLLRPTLGAQIEIEIDPALAADVPLAQADPHQLMTAILRLAIDARDAMPQGGRLSFRSGRAVTEERDAGAGSGAPQPVRRCVQNCCSAKSRRQSYHAYPAPMICEY
jgi:signal transduction histidine kinase